jgi:membrane-associated phospholipid phosphatase
MISIFKDRRITRFVCASVAAAIMAGAVLPSTASAAERDESIIEAGDWLQILLPVSALTTSLALKDWEGAKQVTYVTLASLGTTYVVKYTVARVRPDDSEATSFPSGHTAAAFIGPTFIHRRYGWKYSVPMYFLAGFVGFSRVYADRHWSGDVMAGASVSMISAWLFTTPYKSNMDVSAISIDGEPGLALTVRW